MINYENCEEELSINELKTPIFEENKTNQNEQSEKTQEKIKELFHSYLQEEENRKKGVDIVFCFEASVSIFNVLSIVRTKISQIVIQLMYQIKNIRIGIIAFGDYCNSKYNYAIRILDLCKNEYRISSFVNSIFPTSVQSQCSELALKRARTLSWKKDHSHALVMIGNSFPHPPSYTDQDIWWREEVEHLVNDLQVKIYTVQSTHKPNIFFEELAILSGGYYLTLKSGDLVSEIFLAVCYRETSKEKFDEYRKKKKSEEDNNSSLKELLDGLERPKEKKTEEEIKNKSIRETWYDLKCDRETGGWPQYQWDSNNDKWVLILRFSKNPIYQTNKFEKILKKRKSKKKKKRKKSLNQ